MFPAVDPIPLPAPVWLFKLLHVVTLALHFAAMQLMVGGLVMAAIWAILSRAQGNRTMSTASGAVVTRLPAVMTYVINFGVPPLLFAQVLYGRAIYTSSVLMGAYWISVIFILILAYWLLYVAAGRAEKGRGWGWIALISAFLILKIGAIYSSNMTLMIRPGVWQGMYAADPSGRQFNSADPTMLPRFLFFMVGGLAVAGAGMILLGLKKTLADGAGEFLTRWGGRILAIGILAQGGLGAWALSVQPEGVMEEVGKNALLAGAEYAWLATAALMVAVGAFAGFSPAARRFPVALAACAVAFLNVASMTLLRDGIRDITLLQSGFDVSNREMVANWSVVGIFLFLFVVGVGIVVWLASIVARARQEEECYV